MILDLPAKPKLTYCLNVHPGEGWDDQVRAIGEYVPGLKQKFQPEGKFGVGLRISAQALRDLKDSETKARAVELFKQANLDPFTFNAFPYGTFHGAGVKESVYQPDWKTPERLEYTKDLADLMALFLGPGRGSISSVPLSFGIPKVTEAEEKLMGENLASCVAHLHRLNSVDGNVIVLGLEPEPACHIENTAQFISFYEEVMLTCGLDRLREEFGYSLPRCEEIMRAHLGICLDTCHAAIQFEKVEDSINDLLKAGISIAKIQISNALEIRNSREAREALAAFVEPVYLHQVRMKDANEKLKSWTDLPQGLEGLTASDDGVPARIHFHVPLFWSGEGALGSTQDCLTPAFWKLCRDGVTPHFEMETYTFSVLPKAAGKVDLAEMLEREYRWVLEQFVPST